MNNNYNLESEQEGGATFKHGPRLILFNSTSLTGREDVKYVDPFQNVQYGEKIPNVGELNRIFENRGYKMDGFSKKIEIITSSFSFKGYKGIKAMEKHFQNVMIKSIYAQDCGEPDMTKINDIIKLYMTGSAELSNPYVVGDDKVINQILKEIRDRFGLVFDRVAEVEIAQFGDNKLIRYWGSDEADNVRTGNLAIRTVAENYQGFTTKARNPPAYDIGANVPNLKKRKV